MRITKRQLKRIIREEYTRLKRQGLIHEGLGAEWDQQGGKFEKDVLKLPRDEEGGAKSFRRQARGRSWRDWERVYYNIVPKGEAPAGVNLITDPSMVREMANRIGQGQGPAGRSGVATHVTQGIEHMKPNELLQAYDFYITTEYDMSY